DDAFRLLTGGNRGAPSRQQTLRAALDWSYGLLAPAEQGLFRRLCVFAGGFSLEAAESIGVDKATDAPEVLDLLSQLVDKSLVIAEADSRGSVRYRILETVRQYGHDRLAQAGELDQLSSRHALYFVDLVEQTQPDVPGSTQEIETLDRYERDYS